MQRSWAFSSPLSGATSVMTLFGVNGQLLASAEGPMRRSSAAQWDALFQLRIRYRVFRGCPLPFTQLSHLQQSHQTLPVHREGLARARRQVALRVSFVVVMLVSRRDHRQCGSDVGFGSARVIRHWRPVLFPSVQQLCSQRRAEQSLTMALPLVAAPKLLRTWIYPRFVKIRMCSSENVARDFRVTRFRVITNNFCSPIAFKALQTSHSFFLTWPFNRRVKSKPHARRCVRNIWQGAMSLISPFVGCAQLGNEKCF